MNHSMDELWHANLTYDSMDELWHAVLWQLESAPIVRPRGMAVRERIGITLRLTDSRRCVLTSDVRKARPQFMVAEWLWIWFGRADVASIARFNSQISKYSDDGIGFRGAYGPRIAFQWHEVVTLLRRDPDTRQAVIAIFNDLDVDLSVNSKDVPCTLTLQFLRRADKLHLVVGMRSSDAWLGLPYDLFNFAQLQAIMAATLEVVPGELVVHLGSSHLYEQHWVIAAEAARNPSRGGPRLAALPGPPPASLETILTGDVVSALTDPWRQYAMAALASNRTEALACLRELEG